MQGLDLQLPERGDGKPPQSLGMLMARLTRAQMIPADQGLKLAGRHAGQSHGDRRIQDDGLVSPDLTSGEVGGPWR